MVTFPPSPKGTLRRRFLLVPSVVRSTVGSTACNVTQYGLCRRMPDRANGSVQANTVCLSPSSCSFSYIAQSTRGSSIRSPSSR
uniref:Putative secreted protein n=1 Tax=Anopheles marajoara TaxID=58244 RepID=A0A2M4CB36_9DIPT